ncbi:MAG: FlgD immunoglobulin-like domain containing protein, partial [Candidatus Eisenbacteria bacterium]
YVYAWKGYNGQLISGWPVQTTYLGTQCSPTLGDIDGDGRLEVLLGAEDGRLYAWNHDGTEVAGFPIQLSGEVRGPAVIWDIDGDGYTNVICQDWDKTVYIWDMQGEFNYSVANYPWPMFRHDVGRSGLFTNSILTAVELSCFEALPSERGVVLEWYSNFDDTLNAGWNVYRKELAQSQSLAEGGDAEALSLSGELPDGYARLNAEPIRPVAPHRFSFIDVTAESGRRYSYVLGKPVGDGEVYFGPYAVFVPASAVPGVPALAQNFPNPFNPRTSIAFSVPVGKEGASAKTNVAIRVYDVAGRVVRTLVDEPKAPGFYFVTWDGCADGGERVSGGVYFCRAQIADYSASKKMVVLD